MKGKKLIGSNKNMKITEDTPHKCKVIRRVREIDLMKLDNDPVNKKHMETIPDFEEVVYIGEYRKNKLKKERLEKRLWIYFWILVVLAIIIGYRA